MPKLAECVSLIFSRELALYSQLLAVEWLFSNWQPHFGKGYLARWFYMKSCALIIDLGHCIVVLTRILSSFGVNMPAEVNCGMKL